MSARISNFSVAVAKATLWRRVFELGLLAAVCCCDTPAYAIQRKVYDNTLGFSALNFFSSTFNYTFGRSEGRPVRGPSPTGPDSGVNDVDRMYDYLGLINQYYMEKFGRNGPNGFGGISTGLLTPLDEMRAYVNGNFTAGAFAVWPGNAAAATTVQGYASFTSGWVVPEVVGHEMFHFVVSSNWKNPDGSWQVNPDGTWVSLHTHNEPGTLNEGMADFFGESFEKWLIGSNDWQWGTSVNGEIRSLIVRNLSDPAATSYHITETGADVPYPDRYLSPNFYGGIEDDGGEHHNSTIIGKAAYLAAEGGSFNGYEITGLGMEKVEQIFYHALTHYFVPQESFNLAYQHFLQSTADLYGPTELTEMTKALQAVELNLTRIVVPGDFDANLVVDELDYGTWRRQYGLSVPGSKGADGNGDGLVDAADYVLWRKLVTPIAPPASFTTVPEPSAIALTIFGVAVVLFRRPAVRTT